MDKEGKYWMKPGDWFPVGNLRKIENSLLPGIHLVLFGEKYRKIIVLGMKSKNI